MLVFVLGAQGILAAFFNGWYYNTPDNSLVCLYTYSFWFLQLCYYWLMIYWFDCQVHWIHKHVFVDVWNSERVGTLLYVLFAEIVFWGVFAGILHKLGIYWKLWKMLLKLIFLYSLSIKFGLIFLVCDCYRKFNTLFMKDFTLESPFFTVVLLLLSIFSFSFSFIIRIY